MQEPVATPTTSNQTGAAALPKTADAPATLYCANHPETETLLRCNRCGKPICLKCAKLTDVGYRCKECIRGVQAAYFTAAPTDNLVAFAVAVGIVALAAPISGLLFRLVPFFFFQIILAFMLGSSAGGVLAQIIRASIGKRRGRYLRFWALGGIILGVLVGSFIGLLFGVPPFTLGNLVFTILAAAAAYQILR
jgi:MFS family permease